MNGELWEYHHNYMQIPSIDRGALTSKTIISHQNLLFVKWIFQHDQKTRFQNRLNMLPVVITSIEQMTRISHSTVIITWKLVYQFQMKGKTFDSKLFFIINSCNFYQDRLMFNENLNLYAAKQQTKATIRSEVHSCIPSNT